MVNTFSFCSIKEVFKTVGFLDVKEKDQENEQSTNIPVIIPAAGEDPIFKKMLNGKGLVGKIILKPN